MRMIDPVPATVLKPAYAFALPRAREPSAMPRSRKRTTGLRSDCDVRDGMCNPLLVSHALRGLTAIASSVAGVGPGSMGHLLTRRGDRCVTTLGRAAPCRAGEPVS